MYYRRLIILSLICFLCSGCAGLLTKIRASNEKYAYKMTIAIIDEAMPNSVIDRCGIDLEKAQPITISFSGRMSPMFLGHHGLNVNVVPPDATGVFDPATEKVFYKRGQYDVLVHEYIHFFTNGLTDECVDQMAAYFGQYGYLLIRDNSHLRHENTRLKRLLRSR